MVLQSVLAFRKSFFKNLSEQADKCRNVLKGEWDQRTMNMAEKRKTIKCEGTFGS